MSSTSLNFTDLPNEIKYKIFDYVVSDDKLEKRWTGRTVSREWETLYTAVISDQLKSCYDFDELTVYAKEQQWVEQANNNCCITLKKIRNVSLKNFWAACGLYPQIEGGLSKEARAKTIRNYFTENAKNTKIFEQFINNASRKRLLFEEKNAPNPPLLVIPKQLECYQNLIILDLTNRKLFIVFDFSLPQLKKLFLNDNCLKSVPNFSKLPNLEVIQLNNNQLTSIPDFSKVKELSMIKLKNNQIKSFPSFTHLTKLCHINYQDNPVEQPPMLPTACLHEIK
jgi:hypothetical protein